MNKRDLVNIIAKRVNLPKQDIEEVITLVFNKIIEEVDINQIVRLRDFGTFSKKERRGFVGFNPKTKKKIQVSQFNIVSFRPSGNFKKHINSDK